MNFLLNLSDEFNFKKEGVITRLLIKSKKISYAKSFLNEKTVCTKSSGHPLVSENFARTSTIILHLVSHRGSLKRFSKSYFSFVLKKLSNRKRIHVSSLEKTSNSTLELALIIL